MLTDFNTVHPGCCPPHDNPPWEPPQVIPAQIRRVNNLIFRKINAFSRANGLEQGTPMHGWIVEYLYSQSERAGLPAGHRAGFFHYPLHQ